MMKIHINMRLGVLGICTVIGLLLSCGELRGQDPVITSFETPGRIMWTSPSLNVTCHVEWAASPDGPWQRSWTHQQAIFVTNPSNATEVAMLYRVVCEIPDPHFPDITAEQSLALIANRNDDPGFVVIDVRTASEYTSLHVIGALNIDFNSPAFSSMLDVLDKEKAYLIYCASGNRSGQAHDTMLGLGFHEVYNMLWGMNTFVNLSGAGAYLEP